MTNRGKGVSFVFVLGVAILATSCDSAPPEIKYQPRTVSMVRPEELAVFAAVIDKQFNHFPSPCAKALVDPEPLKLDFDGRKFEYEQMLTLPEIREKVRLLGANAFSFTRTRSLLLPEAIIAEAKKVDGEDHVVLPVTLPRLTAARSDWFRERFFTPEPCPLEDREAGRCGWGAFYKMFPKTCGVWRFSHVAYNGEHTLALVRYAGSWGWLGLEDGWALLEWKDGRWQVKAKRISVLA